MTRAQKGIVTDPEELRTAAASLAAEHEADPDIPAEAWSDANGETWGPATDLIPLTTAVDDAVHALAAAQQIEPPARHKTRLWQRIGDRRATRLLTRWRREIHDEELGRRDPNQPSEALTAIRRAVMRSEFTPDERATIRTLLGIVALADVEGLYEDQS